jgi:hypothetical protein
MEVGEQIWDGAIVITFPYSSLMKVMQQFTKVFLYLSKKKNHDYQLSDHFCEDFMLGNK